MSFHIENYHYPSLTLDNVTVYHVLPLLKSGKVKGLSGVHNRVMTWNPDAFSPLSHCFPNKLWLGNWNT